MRTVIKLGGRTQTAADVIPVLAKAWAESGRSLCLVHGGGDEISLVQSMMGREPVFVNGRRITTAEDMEVVRMVLSGSANKRLVAALVSIGVPAVGVSGEDAGMIIAQPVDADKFGRMGTVTSIRPELIETLLSAGYLPVISPVACDETVAAGAAMNVNGDDAAAAIAGALGADLVMVADVEGVLDASGAAVESLDPAMMHDMIASGEVAGGMRAKLEAGFAALAAGACTARIGSLAAIADIDRGTTLVLTSASVG